MPPGYHTELLSNYVIKDLSDEIGDGSNVYCKYTVSVMLQCNVFYSCHHLLNKFQKLVRQDILTNLNIGRSTNSLTFPGNHDR